MNNKQIAMRRAKRRKDIRLMCNAMAYGISPVFGLPEGTKIRLLGKQYIISSGRKTHKGVIIGS